MSSPTHVSVPPARTAGARRTVVLDVPRFEQPDDVTCGPTCLKKVYEFYGYPKPLQEIIDETRSVTGGGTVCPFLGLNALQNGFAATIYPFNLVVFDPTWYGLPRGGLLEKIRLRRRTSRRKKLREVADAYVEYLEAGGELRFCDLSAGLIHELIADGLPILTGLCATYLYQTPRVLEDRYDDVRGDPEGHFVVVCGSLPREGKLVVRDPARKIPFSEDGRYTIGADRLIQAILMGDSTYDAVFLVVRPLDRA